jgi:hypothetical protein
VVSRFLAKAWWWALTGSNRRPSRCNEMLSQLS